jgi:hypothetical protein
MKHGKQKSGLLPTHSSSKEDRPAKNCAKPKQTPHTFADK